MSKFDNISEKNNSLIYSIFRTETSRDPKGVTNPLWSLDHVATLACVGSVFVQERGTRVKDRSKNGGSKIPFLVLSLLRNQTEKLATLANATRNPQLLLLLRTVGYIVLALKLWPSVSITVITWWLFFIGLPLGQRSIKKYLLFMSCLFANRPVKIHLNQVRWALNAGSCWLFI